jgi:methionyl-tRNA formyltransferase
MSPLRSSAAPHRMRVIFAGTPGFAAEALTAILSAGHDVPLVLTQPDRPAGRHQRLTASPVKAVAQAEGLPLHQPERLRTPEQQAPVLAVPADVMVVAAYGLILPPQVLNHPVHGCLNIHASLLPRWRGAAPIQRAILAGDRETGVCIMQMEAGLDTGPVISRHVIPIDGADTTGTLHDKLARQGALAIVAALATLARDGRLSSTPQPEAGATYAPKVEKAEARIDWARDAATIGRQVRAFNPAPGASTTTDGMLVKIWSATAMAARSAMSGAAGDCRHDADGSVIVRCGDGSLLRLGEVQPASGRRMLATEWLKGRTSDGELRLGT